MKFDRDIYFDSVRASLFPGGMTQQQVDGQNGILSAWEENAPKDADLRHLSYPLATSKHETASTMWPIEEYGKGKGAEYGKPAGPYGEIYYGRGLVQLTWWDNYVRADTEMGWTGDKSCERYPSNQLKIEYAAPTMFYGMTQGWFRTHEDGGAETLGRYFNDDTDDAYEAREIINGDKHIVPSWSGGVNIGNLIKGYHEDFLIALEVSLIEDEEEHGLPPNVLRKLLRRLIKRRLKMESFLAYIMPVSSGVPTHPIAPGGPPPGIWPSPGYPAHPIAPGGPPPGIWPSPGYPAHPIAPGGPPPGYWGGSPLPYPDQGLPGQPPYPSQGPGFPTPPIVLPPYVPGGPPVTIWPSPGRPTHPIVLPPPPPPPEEGVKPPPPEGGWGYSPEHGWGYFPPSSEAGPKK